MAETQQPNPAQPAAPAQPPAPPPMTPERLEAIRYLQKNGMLDQIPAEEREVIAGQLGGVFEAEREAVLDSARQGPPVPEPTATPATPTEVTGTGLGGMPFKAVARAGARGVLKALDVPSGIVAGLGAAANLVNKLNPFASGAQFPSTYEEANAALQMPLVRGAELVQNMFVDPDKRKDLTTYADIVNRQVALDQEIRAGAPGVQERAELGTIALQLGSSVGRNIPKIESAVYGALAKRAAAKVDKLNADLLALGEGSIANAIKNNPEKVREMVEAQRGAISAHAFGKKLLDDLDEIGRTLGERVGQFRDAALADTTSFMDVPQELNTALDQIENVTTFSEAQGKRSLMPPDMKAEFKSLRNGVSTGRVLVSDALKTLAELDKFIGNANDKKGTASVLKSAMRQFETFRRVLKNSIRSAPMKNEQMVEAARRIAGGGTADGLTAAKIWEQADSDYHQFLLAKDGIGKELTPGNAESFVNNLFGRGKQETRDQLAKALAFQERIDPHAQGHGVAFFDRLAQLRAAQKITTGKIAVGDVGSKMVMLENSLDRVVQQRVADIVGRWEKIGAATMGTLGIPLGAVGTAVMGGTGTMAGSIGGGVGLGTLALAGAKAGKHVGLAMANPTRVLEAASKAKALSSKARQLATDMLYLTNKVGPDANMAFLDLVGPVQGLSELTQFVNAQTKTEGIKEK